MITGKKVLLRQMDDKDWQIFDNWGKNRDELWGPYQRFQLDHLPLLKEIYQKNGLLSRDNGMLLIGTIEDQRVVGFVRYSMLSVPDTDYPYPEIGFGIPEESNRKRGNGSEGVRLLVAYLFSGYSSERISAFTDIDNLPAQSIMENMGFQREGIIRKGLFRDGSWHDVAMYGILRDEFKGKL